VTERRTGIDFAERMREPSVARRLVQRLEFPYPPKHGSWLNMVESELAILSKPCLDRRIPEIELLRREVAAWEAERNS